MTTLSQDTLIQNTRAGLLTATAVNPDPATAANPDPATAANLDPPATTANLDPPATAASPNPAMAAGLLVTDVTEYNKLRH